MYFFNVKLNKKKKEILSKSNISTQKEADTLESQILSYAIWNGV